MSGHRISNSWSSQDLHMVRVRLRCVKGTYSTIRERECLGDLSAFNLPPWVATLFRWARVSMLDITGCVVHMKLTWCAR